MFLGDLIPALKNRLGDSNKILTITTLDICGMIALAMGRHFDKYARQITSAVASCLSDNKPQVRAAAISALDAFAESCGVECLGTSLAGALLPEQPLQRKELLKWLGEALEKFDRRFNDMNPFVQPCLMCLQDKNTDVRKYSQSILSLVIDSVGYGTVKNKSQELFKGAQLSSITPLLEAAKSNASVPPTKISSTPKSLAKSKSSRSINCDSAKTSSKTRNAISRSVNTLNIKKESEGVDGKVFPLLTSDPKAKESRSDKDKGMNKWTFDSPRR